ncbi:MAG TPA: fluoride efflux transporter CrcB [Acidobacteriaceae bacterium]|nr:fluoride efflux transporter CrcB [Acidobacteriaceae bacterium]
MSLSKYMYIAVGGALGAIARFWVGSAVAGRLGTRFPYGTFVINITACVLVGFSLTFLARRTNLNPAWRFLIPIGFLGAYSTFSSYEWETVSTLRNGDFSMAALYAFGSLFLGLVAVWCGILIAEIIS